MKDNNHVARDAIKFYKVKYWEVAEALGITPDALSLRFRHEMPMPKQMEIVNIAESIAFKRGL